MLKDSFGDSLLHYVAAAMDEEAIFKVILYWIVVIICALSKQIIIFKVMSAGAEIMCR